MPADLPFAPSGPSPQRWLPLMFFISGATALVYEVAWQREFALLLGASAPASAAVLAAYFTGMGAGSWVVGRFAVQWRWPLLTYAALEIGVVVGVWLVPAWRMLLDLVYPRLHDTFGAQPAVLLAVKGAAAFLSLAAPTFCLGGSLPLLGRWYDAGRRELGRTAGRLYVVNTAGAAVGALAMPFVLFPLLGLRAAVAVATGANLLLALLALRLHHQTRTPQRAAPPDPVPAGSPLRRLHPRLGALAALSGLVTFALQVLWNRGLALVHDSSLQAFAVTVATVIVGLAVGGQMARIALRQRWEPERLWRLAWTLAAGAITAGPLVFLHLSGGLDYLPLPAGRTSPLIGLLLLAGVVLFPAMVLLGVGLPALLEAAGRRSSTDSGWLLGGLYGLNLVGAVAGALCAGFVLPQFVPLWSSVFGLAAVTLAAASALPEQGAPRRALTRRLAPIGGAVGLLVLATVVELPRVRLEPGHGEQLLYLAESAHGITAVVDQPGSRRIKLDNHYALGGSAAVADERLQTHLPLLLHPQPRRVAFLGLGTGISAGAAAFHSPADITVVELVPEVVEAARRHFGTFNEHILEHPRTRIVIDDARHHLRTHPGRYDVIVGDLVVPWRRGEGALFTREQFQAARAALAPGGVFCQWLPLFQLSPLDTERVVQTFLSVFPEAWLWRGDFSPTEPAVALIAGVDSFTVASTTVAQRLALMKPDPANAHLRNPTAVWMHFVAPLRADPARPNPVDLNSENRPWLELQGSLQAAHPPDQRTFTGAALEAWFDARRQPASRDGLRWGEPATSGSAAGRALARLVLALHHGNAVAAEEAQDQLERLLPAEVLADLAR